MADSGRSAVRRTGRVLTGIGALAVLCGVLVGAPVALLALAGNPVPDHLPTVAEIGATLTSRDDGQLFLRALALAGWFGWATFTFSVLVELGAQALRRTAPRLPGMSRQQRAAAALVGSVALIVAAAPAASAATAATTQPYTPAAPAVAAGWAPTVAAQPALAPPPTLAAPPSALAAPPSASAAPDAVALRAVAPTGRVTPPGGAPVYRVAKGDYLGAVAERYLDEFGDYRELARLNHLADPDRIRPGQLLKLPEQATDRGVRPHATGRLVARPAPARPTPTPERVAPGHETRPAPPPSAAETPAGNPPAELPHGDAPAMTVGAARVGEPDRVNRPLAVSAVLAVASIVGAQIGAVLGLRRRPATAGGRATASAQRRSVAAGTSGPAARAHATARELPAGRHRRD
ncbi:LysM domain-containing protein [Micromonospora sp. WMMD812]|uniref:LysM peptidoglycan-binding domain-containing protein n=1 Tax=Micromonospora sp. WMMD812 TaxID=3015152 RepID=UPI00248B23E5|nr:LysM domain-containing protein [Micromonospora sp. WMMD812]WBB65556.1 LysM domain-containing protein [Micromonospora sp. WMMD812]